MIDYHPGHLLGHPLPPVSLPSIKSLKVLIQNKITGTFPTVFHANGLAKQGFMWHKLLKLWESRSLTIQKNEDIEIATWNNRQDKCLLERQLTFFKIPHSVLGRGVKWTYSQDAQWFQKIDTLCAHIPNPKSEYLLFLDGFDILLNGNIEMSQFLNTRNADVWVSAEENAWPRYTPTIQWELRIGEGKGSPFLNSGAICIKASAFPSIKMALKQQVSRTPIQHRDDQYIWHMVYRSLYPKVQIDHKSEFYQSLAKQSLSSFNINA